MDRGAHFHKVDFQVHTPRDAKWSGEPRPVDAGARLACARRFIHRCREIGVDCIAVTDHHDIEFIQYFQYAAQDGQPPFPPRQFPIEVAKQNPVVFPGLELTLAVPCQAIILLAPNCGLEEQLALLTILGPSRFDSASPTGPKVESLSFSLLSDLSNRLDTNSTLRGKYILLPNVNCGGDDTLLRRRFRDKYRDAPCVGGYVDGLVRGHTKLGILNGQDTNWGKKQLAVFQTSDYRGVPESYSAAKVTWVKVAEPTTEALRQACLARHSRIKHSEPQLPSSFIKRLTVSDSSFLGSFEIEFNPQFNALIGGRGTGKTSILEYIRHAMQDQPYHEQVGGYDASDVQEKRKALIENTLHGTVQLEWVHNGVAHIVSVEPSGHQPTLTIAGGEPSSVTGEQLRTLLPLQAYSQKQLSTVSTRTMELQRLVEQPIREELAKYEVKAGAARRRVQILYENLCHVSDREKELRALEVRLASVKDQAKACEEALPELSPQLKKALQENPLRLREKKVIESSLEMLNKAFDTVRECENTLRGMHCDWVVEDASPQAGLVRKLQSAAQELVDQMAVEMGHLLQSRERRRADIDALNQDWLVGQQDHERLYRTAEEEAKEHKERLERIKGLRQDEAALEKVVEGIRLEVSELPQLRSRFDQQWSEWTIGHKEKADLLEKACEDLAGKSGGTIEAELHRGADVAGALDRLEKALNGCGIREANWEQLKAGLSGGRAPDNWMALMKELRVLAEMSVEELPAGGAPPGLNTWQLTDRMRAKIVENLTPTAWAELALMPLADEPVFYYKAGPAVTMGFSDASPGQQATALLKVLLGETTGPLIVDQPEDDLDNAVIQEIAEALWTAKERRQIIFSSHNANIVVNGDAELVVTCAYQDQQDGTKGQIKCQGAIDMECVREAIKTVMEGGEEAFKLRQTKYGF